MKFAKNFAIAAVCFAASFASACQTATTPESPTTPSAPVAPPVKLPSAETPQDQALSKSVRARLQSVKTHDLTGVQVVSSAGTVYLTGTVASLDARQQAIKLAWTVNGVQSVVNALEVQR